jgi:hypothetical protein
MATSGTNQIDLTLWASCKPTACTLCKTERPLQRIPAFRVVYNETNLQGAFVLSDAEVVLAKSMVEMDHVNPDL